MDSQTIFAKLRDILADIYPDEASPRRVVDDAGLDSALISFSTQAKNNWHVILTEADKQGKVNDLLAVALREYGENPELRKACEAYRNFVEQDGGLAPPLDDSHISSSRPPPSDTGKKGRRSPVEVIVAKMGLVGTIITALLGLIGVALTAYFGYLGIQTQAKAPIEATQTAEAKSTMWASPTSATVSSTLTVPSTTSASLPVVILMDSKEPQQIYNPAGKGTNTDDIRDILRYLPIEPPIEELVHTEWDDAEIMSRWEPDLIIIHNSAFYTSTTPADPAKRLSAFLWAMEDTHTKFLIYSRADSFSDEGRTKQDFEKAFPFLEGRVDVLWVPKKGEPQYCSYWACSDTREKLRRKVKSLLGLP